MQLSAEHDRMKLNKWAYLLQFL